VNRNRRNRGSNHYQNNSTDEIDEDIKSNADDTEVNAPRVDTSCFLEQNSFQANSPMSRLNCNLESRIMFPL